MAAVKLLLHSNEGEIATVNVKGIPPQCSLSHYLIVSYESGVSLGSLFQVSALMWTYWETRLKLKQGRMILV